MPDNSETAPTVAGVSAAPLHGAPKVVIRHRTRSAIYAKVAGDLDALLDMAEQEPPEWLPAAVRGVHGRYVAEMEHSTAEADRLQALHRIRWQEQRTMPEPERTLSLLIANATPREATTIRAVAMRAGLLIHCECGTYNTAPEPLCVGCGREIV